MNCDKIQRDAGCQAEKILAFGGWISDQGIIPVSIIVNNLIST